MSTDSTARQIKPGGVIWLGAEWRVATHVQRAEGAGRVGFTLARIVPDGDMSLRTYPLSAHVLTTDAYREVISEGVEILGADDWLVFGVTRHGLLTYTITETLSDWLDAPNGGRAEYGTPEHAADWRYILATIGANPAAYTWTLSTDPDTGAQQYADDYRGQFRTYADERPAHADGTADARYSVSHEYTGRAEGVSYVARFADQWIGTRPSASGAWNLAREHALARQAAMRGERGNARVALLILGAALAALVALLPFALSLPAHAATARTLPACASRYGQGSVLPCAVHSRHRSQSRVLRYIGHGEILSVWPDGNADLILLSACANEDGSGGPLPCRWDAHAEGNGRGESYDVLSRGGRRVMYVYDSGTRAYGGI